MKKEIEITFKKDTCLSDEKNILVRVYILRSEKAHFTLEKRNFVCDLNCGLLLRELDMYSFDKLLKNKEIKELYDKHFKKEVDLFEWFFHHADGYCIDISGKTSKVNELNTRSLINDIKSHYNIFPTQKLCEKAKPMSLDERKQFLFAIAKGYEVLTREESIKNNNDDFVIFYNRTFKSWSVHNDSVDCTYNIYFTTLEQARECAKFMNETKEIK